MMDPDRYCNKLICNRFELILYFVGYQKKMSKLILFIDILTWTISGAQMYGLLILTQIPVNTHTFSIKDKLGDALRNYKVL